MSFSISSDDGVSLLPDLSFRTGPPSASFSIASDWDHGDNQPADRNNLKLDLSSSCSSSPSLWSPFTPPESPMKKKIESSSAFGSAERPKTAKASSTSTIKRVQSSNKIFRRSRSIPKFGKEPEKTEMPTLSPFHVSDEMTFKVRRSMFGRHGWIVMADDEKIDLKQLNGDVMHRLADKIRDLEFSGKDVPSQITLRVKD